MHLALFLLSAIAVVSARADATVIAGPDSEMLQIHNDHVVHLYLGNPGKWLRFRVRADSSSIYLFQHPSPYSDTWIALPEPDAYGQPRIRDTLVIGSTQMRVDMIVGRFPAETAITVEGTQAEGVLGIAARSPLWIIWRNFTKSRDILALGRLLHDPADQTVLMAELPPPWTYGLGIVSSFVGEFRAQLSTASREALEKDCIDALGSVIDEAVDLAGSGDALATVLGVSADEQLCMVPAEYRLLLVPDSDFNVIPRVLMMHRLNTPPIFHVSSLAETQNTAAFSAVLFDRFDDMYVELDTTNNAGAGVRRMANHARSGRNNTIILGEYGLRRFEICYDIDAPHMHVTLRHTGLSRSGQTHAAMHSIEVRRIQDIIVLVAGLLLWALLATEPYPVYPRHTKQDNRHYQHAKKTGMPNPTGSAELPQLAAAAAPDDGDDEIIIAIRSPGDTSAKSPLSHSIDSKNTSVSALPGQRRKAEMQRIAAETGIRIGTIIQATFRMESEWPLSLDTLLYVQTMSEAIVAIYFALSLGFYDTTWALAMVLSSNPDTDALGWTTLSILLASVVVLSIVGSFSAGNDARLGALALQTQVLIAIYILLVSLFQWDLALGLLFVVSGLITVVLLVGTMLTWGLVPQYHRQNSTARLQMRAPMAIVSLAWLLYTSLALFPFIINRLWDNEDQAIAIGVFLVLAVAMPIGIYMSFAPFVYPLLPANEACQRVFAAVEREYKLLTGSI